MNGVQYATYEGLLYLTSTCLKTQTEREGHMPSYVSHNHLSNQGILPSTKRTHLLFMEGTNFLNDLLN